jgi:DNA polymerase I-like protein with 3'-5' exonuclease and polymerase domains
MTGFTYVRLTDRASVAALFQRFNDLKVNVVLDLETTGLNRFKDTIICGVVAVAGETTAFWVPPEFLDELTKLTTPLVLHNFKFDFAFLYHAGIDLRGKEVWDTMLMHHLLDENAEHGLDAIIQEKWNDPYKEVFWSAYKSFEEAPEDAAFDYAGRDVLYTGRLFHELHSGLQLQGVPHSLIVHVHSLATALYETELSGVRVDLDYLVRVGEELKARIASATTAMKLAAPEHELVEMDMWLAEMDKRKTPKGKAQNSYKRLFMDTSVYVR